MIGRFVIVSDKRFHIFICVCFAESRRNQLFHVDSDGRQRFGRVHCRLPAESSAAHATGTGRSAVNGHALDRRPFGHFVERTDAIAVTGQLLNAFAVDDVGGAALSAPHTKHADINRHTHIHTLTECISSIVMNNS